MFDVAENFYEFEFEVHCYAFKLKYMLSSLNSIITDALKIFHQPAISATLKNAFVNKLPSTESFMLEAVPIIVEKDELWPYVILVFKPKNRHLEILELIAYKCNEMCTRCRYVKSYITFILLCSSKEK